MCRRSRDNQEAVTLYPRSGVPTQTQGRGLSSWPRSPESRGPPVSLTGSWGEGGTRGECWGTAGGEGPHTGTLVFHPRDPLGAAESAFWSVRMGDRARSLFLRSPSPPD